ncbi:molybdopterin cofactor-binding domain-containing protein, partial [Sinomicrobium weinanense]
MIPQTRRNFIKTAGSLTIGFSLGGIPLFPGVFSCSGEIPDTTRSSSSVNAWLEILPNGNLRVFTGKIEIGQGIRTAIAQVAAEELNMDMEKIEVVLADTDRTPNESYTSGSRSIESSAMSVRHAAAYARQKLLDLAAKRLNTSTDDLWIKNGKVGHKNDKKTVSFNDILGGHQIEDEVNLEVQLKPRADRKVIGKPVPRQDI